MKTQKFGILGFEIRWMRHLVAGLGSFALLVAVTLLSASPAAAAATNVFLAQASAGAGNGADCADALPVSWFNNGADWGSGATQIGAGTTVHLCGTITTNLTFQGNGASGNPVILDGTNATMSDFINVGSQYWTIQNCTWSTSYGTNNGNQAVIQTQGGAAFGTILNNHVDIMSSGQVIFFSNITHDITVQNNYLKMNTPSGGAGFQTDTFDSEGAYNIMVEGNVIAANISAADNNSHDDLTQVWASGSSSANANYNWTFRYNNFLQESASGKTNNLSFMMMEAIGTGYWDVYSNVFQCVSGGSSGNGITFDGNTSGMVAHIYGNTIVQNSGACNNLFNLSGAGSYNLVNNITYNSSAGNALTGGVTFATRSNNLWDGPNIPSCVATEICSQNPLFNNFAGNNFSLQSGSPAIGKGANLGSSYSVGIAPGATWPNPSLINRPSSSAWDMGAYQSGVQPAPPTGLSAIVN